MRPGPNHIGTAGATDGDALLYDAATDEYAPGPLPASGVESIVEGTNVNVDDTDPAHPIVSATIPATVLVPWTTTLSDGTPSLMWDDDDNLMMVEVPR